MARLPISLLAFWLPLALLSQTPPTFTADRVQLANSTRHLPLEPGMTISIYGDHLGPAIPCQGFADQHHFETLNSEVPDPMLMNLLIYPKILCETQVLIGDLPVGLLYVSEKQINFKVPQEVPVKGPALVKVIYDGIPSTSAVLEFGIQKTAISLEEPAHVGMPVWLKVELPLGYGPLRYPYALGPANFGCNEVEVTRDGSPVPKIQPEWMASIAISGSICGSYSLPAESSSSSRLPLHMLYRFDAPGIYQVRYTMRDMPFTHPGERIRLRSEWTNIEILPEIRGERAAMLQDLQQNPPTGPGRLLTDVLPSILGFPDELSLDILSSYLYHPDNSVWHFASNGLQFWPKKVVSTKLRELLHTKGPNPEVERLLSELDPAADKQTK